MNKRALGLAALVFLALALFALAAGIDSRPTPPAACVPPEACAP